MQTNARAESKIRKAVYMERGYPEDGDPEAEAEIYKRLDVPDPKKASYEDAMAAAMVEAGVDLSPLDAVLALDE